MLIFFLKLMKIHFKNNIQLDWLLTLEGYELALQNNYPIKFLKCNKSYIKRLENGLVLCKI